MDRPTPHASAGERREGQTIAGSSLAARYATFVKLPHTLFTLPFAGVGAVLASYTHPQGVALATLAWIVLAFTAARFAAMGFNRIADRRWDALNARTRARELPSGRLTLVQASAAVVAASVIFVFAAWQLNPLCGVLAPVALAWIFFYSYTKRFTAWSHHVLGLAMGIAPVGAYLAIAGGWSRPAWGLVALAAVVMFWGAGFDVIYALQDVDFDREHGLRSIPARIGTRRALRLSRAFHASSIVLLLALWALDAFPVGWLYLVGTAAAALILHFEHAMVRRGDPEALDLDTINRAFFRANVGVSTSLFVLVLLDRLLLYGAS